MMNHFLQKLKNIIKDLWEDFSNPGSPHSLNSTCCCYTLPDTNNNLRPEFIRVKHKTNQNSTKLKNPQL